MNTEHNSTPTFDRSDLRKALGSFGTGVTIVSTKGADNRLIGVQLGLPGRRLREALPQDVGLQACRVDSETPCSNVAEARVVRHGFGVEQ
jgi:hypothetical protein